MFRNVFASLVLSCLPAIALAQFDEDQVGAWYMYMWNMTMEDSGLGFQGDVQHRNWDIAGDLEQMLVRGGATWTPEGSMIKYTLGYAYTISGAFGPSDAKTKERRVYQEALLPQRIGTRGFITHRLRFEQRDIDNQDLRTRLRYSIGLNYPFNQDTLGKGAVYLALSNEIFLNLEQDIGQNSQVDYFDRNRAYAALGYSFTDEMRFQFGYMQQELDESGKGQLQFSLIHAF
jgi:hypothetical protein